MANTDFIGGDMAAVERIQAQLKKLPPELKDVMADAVYGYWLRSLRTSSDGNYQPYKFFGRATAYGPQTWNDIPPGMNITPVPGYFSYKQWAFVMIGIANGTLKAGADNRTGELKRGWRVEGRGYKALLVNETPYAKYVQGDGEQARQPRGAGWRMITEWVKERSRMYRAVQAAEKAISDFIDREFGKQQTTCNIPKSCYTKFIGAVR